MYAQVQVYELRRRTGKAREDIVCYVCDCGCNRSGVGNSFVSFKVTIRNL